MQILFNRACVCILCAAMIVGLRGPAIKACDNTTQTQTWFVSACWFVVAGVAVYLFCIRSIYYQIHAAWCVEFGFAVWRTEFVEEILMSCSHVASVLYANRHNIHYYTLRIDVEHGWYVFHILCAIWSAQSTFCCWAADDVVQRSVEWDFPMYRWIIPCHN